MTMDWESWLRGETSPSLKHDDSSGKTVDSSQAKVLGLPVVLSEEMDAGSADQEKTERLPNGETASDFEEEPSSAFSETGRVPAEGPETSGADSLFDDDERLLLGISRPVSVIEDGKKAKSPKESSSNAAVSSDDFPVAPVEAEPSGLPSEERLQDSLASLSRAVDDITADDTSFSPEPRTSGESALSESYSEETDHEDDDVPAFIIPAQPLYPLPDAPVSSRQSTVPEKEERKKKRVLPVLLVTAVLVLGGLFFTTGESFDEIIQKGEEAYARSEYDKALAYYSKASDKEPLRIEALWGVAQTLESLGRKGEAVDAWYRCLQLAPENASVYARLGGLLYDLGSLDNAIRNFQESLHLDSENIDIHAALGKAFEAKGDYKQAVAAYRNALALDENRSDLEDALFAAENELQIRENERRERAVMAEEQMRLGISALVSQDYTGAEGHFLRALDLVPEFEDAFLGLAEARLGKEDIDGAKEVYRNLLASHPHSERGNEALHALEPFLDDEDLPTTSTAHDAPETSASFPEGAEPETAETISISSSNAEETMTLPVEQEERPEAVQPPAPIETTLDGESPEALEEKRSESEEHGRTVELACIDENAESLSPAVGVEPSPPSTISPVKEDLDAAVATVSDPAAVVSEKEQPRKDAPTPKRARDEGRTRVARVVSAAPSPKRQERRDSLYSVAALRKNEELLLSESRKFNLSGEYPKAAEKASEALRIQQSPEALSNIGFAHIGLGNYPAAFTAYWRRLLLSSEVRSSVLEPPAFFPFPFEEGRWKEIPVPDPGDLPLNLRSEGAILLPGGSAVFSRVLAGKEYLFEALRLNPPERDVYLNLSLSYLLMRNQGVSVISFPASSVEGINENALYLAILAHAWRVRDDDERSGYFLNAAAQRASGEILRFVRSLERLPVPGGKRRTGF